jgi:hypothetical protein
VILSGQNHGDTVILSNSPSIQIYTQQHAHKAKKRVNEGDFFWKSLPLEELQIVLD